MILRKTTLVLAALLLIFFVRGCALNNYQSMTSDEPPSFAMGATYWLQGDFSYSPTHPPLKSYLTYWFTQHLNPNNTVHREQGVDEFLAGRLYLFKENNAIFQKLIWWGRLPFLLVGLLGAVYVYRWAKEVSDRKSALFATALYVFLPTIAALSSVLINDILVSTFSLMTLYYFRHYISSGTWKDAWLTGLCLGVALLSKHTAILLVPLMLIIALVLLFSGHPVPMLPRFRRENEQGKGRQALAVAAFFVFIGLVSGVVLNAGYFFDGTMTPLRDYKFDQHFFKTFNNPAISWMPVPLPYWYFKGLETNQIFSKDAHYFHGKFVTTEDWYFFLFSFVTKTPLALLAMLAIGLALYPKLKKGRAVDMAFIAMVIIGIIGFFSIEQYKLGIRHVLPVYPFIFIFAALVWHYAHAEKKKALRYTLYALFAWYIIASVLVHPYYMSYFNELIGGSQNGYKYFLDSNVDWGQDLNAVKAWMDETGNSEIGLSYFGSDVPELRGIKSHMIPCEPAPGLQVLSVNNLFGQIFTGQPKECYSWLRKVEPSDRIAYSILVFNIPEKANQSIATPS
jgi:4-amino-4-deoxy-L-arabinose transferase-like glycosyltransferase